MYYSNSKHLKISRTAKFGCKVYEMQKKSLAKFAIFAYVLLNVDVFLHAFDSKVVNFSSHNTK